ncbi:hypothetical protein AJ79_07281, partial [Helicocarpus griseus UAMH5409]
MRVAIFLLALFSVLLSSVNGQDNDRQVLASFEGQGLCFAYIGEGDIAKAVSPCNKWCVEHGKKPAIECHTPIKDLEKIDQSIIRKDDNGHLYVPGQCVCEDKTGLENDKLKSKHQPRGLKLFGGKGKGGGGLSDTFKKITDKEPDKDAKTPADKEDKDKKKDEDKKAPAEKKKSDDKKKEEDKNVPAEKEKSDDEKKDPSKKGSNKKN